MVLDMGHVPFMSIGGLRLLDRLLSYGAKSGVHVVMIGWQPAAAAARGAVFAHRPLRATGGGLPRRRGPEPDPRNPGPHSACTGPGGCPSMAGTGLPP
ncbi:STAS domain-containing protein [Streptomyces microflavus]|uniref:STAS domain-containing protein n=1 Tax=Streptomyces microflavus TaxID=1919 RepID=UPI003422AA60